jgi:hypothetical protein
MVNGDGLERLGKTEDDFTEIKLKIHKNVLNELRTGLGIKMICASQGGTQDNFIAKLLAEIEKGEKEITFIFRRDKR